MDFYAQLFEPMLPHLKAYWVLYLVGGPILAGVLVLTRRYSVPIIVFVIEFVVYSVAMHIVVHVLARVFAWFKNSSAMRMVDDPSEHVHWTTPVLRFWHTEIYDPEWVLWLEVVFLGIILVLMYRFQPPKPQYKHQSRYQKPVSKKPSSADDDDWGTPKKFTAPADVAKKKKKRR